MIQWYAVIWLALLRTSRGEISDAPVETAPDVFDAATRRLQYLSDDDYALVEQCYERDSYLEINDFLTENLDMEDSLSLSYDYAYFVTGNGLAWCLGGDVVSALVNGESEVICSTDYMEDGDFPTFVDACAEIGGAFLVANVTRTCVVESGDNSLDQVENFFNMPDCVNQTKAFACWSKKRWGRLSSIEAARVAPSVPRSRYSTNAYDVEQSRAQLDHDSVITVTSQVRAMVATIVTPPISRVCKGA
jgi:hypothetical protein